MKVKIKIKKERKEREEGAKNTKEGTTIYKKTSVIARRNDADTKRQDSRFATRSDPKGERQELRNNPLTRRNPKINQDQKLFTMKGMKNTKYKIIKFLNASYL